MESLTGKTLEGQVRLAAEDSTAATPQEPSSQGATLVPPPRHTMAAASGPSLLPRMFLDWACPTSSLTSKIFVGAPSWLRGPSPASLWR